MVLLAGALSLSACGTSSSSSAPSADAGTTSAPTEEAGATTPEATGECEVKEVAWWTAYGGDTLPAILAEQVDEFNNTHPCIHVTNTQVLGGTQGADSERKFLTAVAGGTGPDLWTSSNIIAAPYAESGAVLPLDDYLTGDYAGVMDWLYPAVVVGGSYKGTLYGIPESMNSEAVFYNKDIMADIGEAELPTTIEEFDRIQDKAWIINGQQIQRLGFYPEPTRIPIYFPQFGGTLDTTNGKYEWANNEGNLALMRWVQSYGEKYPFTAFSAFQSAVGSGNQAGSDPFTAGLQLYYLNGPWEGTLTIANENPALFDSIDTFYFPSTPTGPAGPATYVNGNYTFLAKGSKNPDEAFEFLMWMAGYNNEDFTAHILNQVGWLPASQKVVDSATYQGWIADNPWAKAIVDVFGSEYSFAMENTLGSNAATLALYSATEAVLTGKMTPEEALASADKAGNDALANGGEGN